MEHNKSTFTEVLEFTSESQFVLIVHKGEQKQPTFEGAIYNTGTPSTIAIGKCCIKGLGPILRESTAAAIGSASLKSPQHKEYTCVYCHCVNCMCSWVRVSTLLNNKSIDALIADFYNPQHGIVDADKRYQFHKYSHCFMGKEAIFHSFTPLFIVYKAKN